MKIANISYKKLFRYPKFLSFLFSPSAPLSLYLSSSPKTLNPSLSFNPVTAVFHSHQLHTNHYFYISGAGPLSDCSVDSLAAFRFSTSYRYPLSRITLLRHYCPFRWFSVRSSDDSLTCTSLETVVFDKNGGFGNMDIDCFDESEFREKTMDGFEPNVSPKQISQIIDVIRSGNNDLDSELNLMGLNLSVRSISEIFGVLNCERISALRFFQWVRDNNPNLYRNHHVCNLIIDNCGWLDDYRTMISMLKEFSLLRICLSEKAFGFLPILGSSKASIMESIRRLIEVLNEVGGSCRGSGIPSLIKMLCSLDCFEMAEFVLEITERNVGYYNILIQGKCRRCCFEEARGLIKEMRDIGCDPIARTYNYLFGGLCKSGRTAEALDLLEEMQQKGTPPDASTFDIFIYHSCRFGKLDVANQFLKRMVSWGLEPRLTTHAALVKGYFNARHYEEAHKYVHDSGARYIHSSNMIYSLLASLHQQKGDLIVARNILIEMMEKDLKPYFPVFKRIKRRLQKTGRGDLARDLESRFRRVLSGTPG